MSGNGFTFNETERNIDRIDTLLTSYKCEGKDIPIKEIQDLLELLVTESIKEYRKHSYSFDSNVYTDACRIRRLVIEMGERLK